MRDKKYREGAEGASILPSPGNFSITPLYAGYYATESDRSLAPIPILNATS